MNKWSRLPPTFFFTTGEKKLGVETGNKATVVNSVVIPFPVIFLATCNGQQLIAVIAKVLSGNHTTETKLAAAQK